MILYPSEEGYAIGCPALPGCWSQGDTEEEALNSIKDATREYLSTVRHRRADRSIRREVEVLV